MAQKRSSSRKRSNPQTQKKSSNSNKTMMIAIVVIIIAVVVIAAGVMLLNQTPSDSDNDNQNNGVDGNPIASIDTSKGVIEIELYANETPKTVDNFIKLANEGFYDGMIFHRISDNFMIQAGNTYPDGSTKTSPYGNIAEFEGGVSHVDGAISMASTGAGVPGSAQFFICDGAQSFLDGSYAAFGVVISGIDVVRDIADEDHDGSFEPNPGGGKPITDIIINSISIED